MAAGEGPPLRWEPRARAIVDGLGLDFEPARELAEALMDAIGKSTAGETDSTALGSLWGSLLEAGCRPASGVLSAAAAPAVLRWPPECSRAQDDRDRLLVSFGDGKPSSEARFHCPAEPPATVSDAGHYASMWACTMSASASCRSSCRQ